ncbi:S41 family peptidase [Streptomyces sp. JNUCC 64]
MGVALALSGSLGTAVAVPGHQAGAPRTVEGTWRMDGYGMVVGVRDGVLRTWDTTAISCAPALTMPREGRTGTDGAARFSADGLTLTVRPRSGTRATLRIHGTVGARGLERIAALPKRCERPQPTGPRAAFDVFWRTFQENYAFFRTRGVDWREVRDTYRPRVHAGTTPDELFDVLAEMTEPLRDGHVSLEAPELNRSAQVGRPGTREPDEALEKRTRRFIERRDLGGTRLKSYAQGAIGYADLPGGLGYLRINRFVGYAPGDGGYTADAAALERALDRIVTRARTSGPNRWRGLIVDVRVNAGGYDGLGLAVASRLTDRSYPAFAKQARNDPRDATRFTRPQTVKVKPAPGAPRYDGPVAVLIGGSTVSAGETFTHALDERPAPTTLIGENTQGIFSDILPRTLSNGWSFGLSNERYTDPRGRSFEGPGIPPGIAVPVFTEEEFAANRDSAFDRATALLTRRR